VAGVFPQRNVGLEVNLSLSLGFEYVSMRFQIMKRSSAVMFYRLKTGFLDI